jgi:hypothetical protein
VPEKRKNDEASTPSVEKEPPEIVERPYDGVKPVAYVPLRPGERYKAAGTPVEDRPAGDKSAEPKLADTSGPAYRAKAPIELDTSDDVVLKKILEAETHVTIGELLGSAPGARESLKKYITKKRVNSESVGPREVTLNESPYLGWLYDDEEAEDISQVEETAPQHVFFFDKDLPRVKWVRVDTDDAPLARGSLFVPDPIVQYFEGLSEEDRKKQVYVAHESKSLRCVDAVINRADVVECVLDGGSQIVSMAQGIAHETCLPYDPDFKISMQSANGELEMTLGLARNVPFVFGATVLYMQVHIMRNPPYKVLLGRPFDCLTESTIKNWADGGQTVTITDPNTGHKTTIPTYERGRRKIIKRDSESEGFQNSRS